METLFICSMLHRQRVKLTQIYEISIQSLKLVYYIKLSIKLTYNTETIQIQS